MKFFNQMSIAMATLVLSAGAVAVEYPERPITMIVPYPAGGSTDATARMLSERLTRILKQTVIIDNKAGAGGNIGAYAAARAKPDGYTILMITVGHTTSPALYKNLNYDLLRDFEPVTRVAYIPNVLVVESKFPASDLKTFVNKVRQSEIPVTFGAGGIGNCSHLSGLMLADNAKAKMTFVPYKGGAPAVADLLGGQIDSYFSPLMEVRSFLDSGRLKAIAVTTAEKTELLPNVAAISEQFPGYECTLWNGLMMPKGTPVEIIQKVNAAVVEALSDPETVKTMAVQGSTAAASTPVEFGDFLKSEIANWQQRVQKYNIKSE